MPTIHVDLAERSYDVLVERGLLESTGSYITNLGLKGKIAIITDTNVAPHYAEKLESSLETAGYINTLHKIPAGEASKSMSQAEQLCREMIREGHDRNSFVIALGGGVVGDLAGYVASIFYRGIPFVQIPTTIVSQVDSSVGGKTGVNVAEGKNLVGAFHQPKLVLVDPDTLTTLPPREYKEGFAEVIKHAAIRDAEMLTDIAALDPNDPSKISSDLIARNISIKARVVEEDEKETAGTRALLNFGHTIGHGIEASVPYGSLLHGEAISLGIRAALQLSEQESNLNKEDSIKVLNLLKHFNLPLRLSEEITTKTIIEKMMTDKKFSGGQIRFVLLHKAGSAFVSKDITMDHIEAAIENLRD